MRYEGLVIGLIILILLIPPINVKANPGITHDFVTIDACDMASNWIPLNTNTSLSNNTVNYKQGTGALNIFKTGTYYTDFGAYKTISATSVDAKEFVFYFFINSDAKSKLTATRFYIYDSAGNYVYWDLPVQVGWNEIIIMPRDSSGGYGYGLPKTQYKNKILIGANRWDGASATLPDFTAITKIQFYFNTPSGSTTIAEGSIAIDSVVLGSSITYEDSGVGFKEIYLAVQSIPEIAPLVDFDGSNFVVFSYQFGTTSASSITDSYKQFITVNLGYQKILDRIKLYGVLNFNYVVFDCVQYAGSQTKVYIGSSLTLRNSLLKNTGLTSYNLPNGATVENSVINSYNFYYDSVNAKRITVSLTGAWYVRSVNYLNDAVINIITWYYTSAPVNVYKVQVNEMRATNAYVNIYDSPFPSKIAVYSSSELRFIYSLNLTLRYEDGSPVTNAHILIYDVDGNNVFDGYTDSKGKISTTLKYYVIGADSSGVQYSKYYTPHRLVAYKDGNKILDYKFVMNTTRNEEVSVTRLYYMDTWFNKPSYQTGENVILYSRFFDWNSIVITGLSVKANITKPDNSTVTISLRDDGISPDQVANDGIYTGQFNKTDQVGTYFVKVNTTIYGNLVEAKTSFDVGSIEQKIEAVNQSIISKLSSVNLSIISQLGKVNISLSDLIKSANLSITNLIKSVNITLSDLIKSSNLTVIKQITNSTNNITVLINNTRVDLEGRLSDILRKLATAGTGSSTTVTAGSSYPTTMMFWPNASVQIPVIVMSLLVFMFGILLYKKHKEKRRWVYTRD